MPLFAADLDEALQQIEDWIDEQKTDEQREAEGDKPDWPDIQVPTFYADAEFHKWLGLTRSQVDQEPDDWVHGQRLIYDLKAKHKLF